MRIKPIFKSILPQNNKLSVSLPIIRDKLPSKNNIVMGSLLALATIYHPVKPLYNATKTVTKNSLELVGIDASKQLYKDCAQFAHIVEPTCSGIAHTAEFMLENPRQTGSVLSDLVSSSLGKGNVDSEKLFNYLYECSKKSDADLRQLLKELPEGSISDVLKYINNTISKKKNIPCSRTCMDIALSNPSNIKTAEYQTVSNKVLEDLISEYKDKLPEFLSKNFDKKLPLIEFKSNSIHSKMLQENDKIQRGLRRWANKPENERPKIIVTALNTNSDKVKGYDAYATFHNILIMNPSIDKQGNIHAYVYDIYDFDKGAFNGQMLDFATIMAYHLQETGHLKNYKMLIPITIPAK